MDFPFDLQELPAFAVIGSVAALGVGLGGWGRAGTKLWIGKDPSWEIGVGMSKVEILGGEVGRKGRWRPDICFPAVARAER